MSRTYRVCDRGGLLFIGIAFSVIGGFLTLTAVLSLVGWPPFSREVEGVGRTLGHLIGVAISGGGAYLGCQHFALRPWIITIDPPDVLAFHRAFRTTTIRLADVHRIERRGRSVTVEDEDSRVLAIEHSRGTVTVSHFPAIDDFLADVRSLKPSVRIAGAWELDD